MSLKKSLLLILSVALFLIIILSSTTVLLTSSLRQMILDNRTIHIAVDTAIISENITGTYEISPSNDEYQYSELANQDKFIYLSATVAMIALPTLYLDKQIIFKILENLLNNAFRFANNGVKLTIMETVGYLEFVIQDDGPGFSKNNFANYLYW